MPRTFRNFIAGKWSAPSTGAYFDNINPANTRDVIGKLPRSGKADVDRAVAAATKGFAIWKNTPAPLRG
ncbi:MAG: aldehyde dehydrogenase family protein, partial [Gemmatimonadaceae bacterium]